MIHLLTAAAVITAAVIAGLTYLVAGKVVPWRLSRSVLAGLVQVGPVRHGLGEQVLDRAHFFLFRDGKRIRGNDARARYLGILIAAPRENSFQDRFLFL